MYYSAWKYFSFHSELVKSEKVGEWARVAVTVTLHKMPKLAIKIHSTTAMKVQQQ